MSTRNQNSSKKWKSKNKPIMEILSGVFMLAVIIPSVAAVLVYRNWRLSQQHDPQQRFSTQIFPVQSWQFNSVSTIPGAGINYSSEVSSSENAESRNSAQLFIGPNNPEWAAPEKEYDCIHMNGKFCPPQESEGGPIPDLIKPVILSEKDLSLFRSLIENKTEREVLASELEPTIAFLFLTLGPLPHAPLWERFFKGYENKYNIYVHTNPKFEFTEADSAIFRNAKIPSEQAVWGQPQMVDAERRLLANALLNPSNQKFILLSETCIPIRPFEQVWEYLFSTNLSFVESSEDESFKGRGTYNPWMKPQIQPSQWRRGSQWWTLGRKHAYIIVQDRRIWFKVQQYCRADKWHRHCHADEHYFQTVLHIHDSSGVANRSVTMADWTRGGAQPRVVTKTLSHAFVINAYRDMTEQSAQMSVVHQGMRCSLPGEDYQRTCFLFLRKVHPKAIDNLLKLGPEVFGF